MPRLGRVEGIDHETHVCLVERVAKSELVSGTDSECRGDSLSAIEVVHCSGRLD